MRVLQIIDSLDAGGAERMAVNYANGLATKIGFSGIVITRNEGALQEQLKENVAYFFLNKKSTLDFNAIFKLKQIVKNNRVTIIHAHGTSFFTVFLLKIIYFKIKVIYHEHYGNRANQSRYKNIFLLFCLFFFDKIIVVNHQLKDWFIQSGFKKTLFLPNFANFDKKCFSETTLYGQESKRIVLLGNLKTPKNHILALRAFHTLNLKKYNWSIHFIGKIFNDDYSKNLLEYSKEFGLSDFVHLYNAKQDIKNILSQATIGILCSTDEGFPVTLLEYGLAKLPVVCSNVGFCSEIIIPNKTGLLFESNNVDDLVTNLNILIANEPLQKQFGENLHNLVTENYTETSVLINYLSFLEN